MDTRAGVTRREFLRRSLITAAGVATGVSAVTGSSEQTSASESLRLVFATDIHLMQNDALRSEDGLAAAVEAIKGLQPRLDRILSSAAAISQIRRQTWTIPLQTDCLIASWAFGPDFIRSKPIMFSEITTSLAQRTRWFLNMIRGLGRGCLRGVSHCPGCITLSKTEAGVLSSSTMSV